MNWKRLICMIIGHGDHELLMIKKPIGVTLVEVPIYTRCQRCKGIVRSNLGDITFSFDGSDDEVTTGTMRRAEK